MGIATQIIALTHPPEESALRTGEGHRSFGVFAAVVGWAVVGIAFLIGLSSAALAVASGSTDQLLAQQAIAFGLATAGLGTAKTGIAFVLWGIVRRIWVRFGSVKAALPRLVAAATGSRPVAYGEIDTAHGRATVSHDVPSALFIHRMARAVWLPTLAMGLMALYLGLVLAYVESGSYGLNAAAARSLKAWVQGIQFLGEGLLLSGIAFLLGTILAALREGGGQVQKSIGAPVKTLNMPLTAKLFIGIMMVGMMLAVAQFLVYAYVATLPDAQAVRTYSAWLGPFREFALGTILVSITLALVTIARVMNFQFSRIRELITTGK